jgi:hypothetical protein
MEIDKEIVGSLTYRGVLAYVATQALGRGKWTTAELAQSVSCNTSLLLEGLQELHTVAPEVVGKQFGFKWEVGGEEQKDSVQILDSQQGRRKDFLDDLKRYWDWGNPNVPFTMTASDGAAVQRWLKKNKEWDQPMWRQALKHRCMSEVNHSQALFAWVGRLAEYSATPLDRYGKPMPNGIGGKHGEIATVRQRNREAVEQAIANA